MADTGRSVARWEIFEVAAEAKTAGNPFTDTEFFVTFAFAHRTVRVRGFYDGEDTFRARFMPDTIGEWTYRTESDNAALHGLTGWFECVAPALDSRGPVGVSGGYHFAYADGTPYLSIGTTCYAWTHQGDALEEQTLETLRNAPFNKLRMCVFPKHYDFSHNEPEYYPFFRDESGAWDFARFDPAFFRHLETRIGQLRDLGIEADLILFHPYDNWGFATMDGATDDRYLRYLIARLSAYRNVWWSLANEWDLMAKSEADWERILRVIQEEDPYSHLRSIHNCIRWYDHNRPGITHISVQNSDLYRVREWRETYRKPVVVDECCYEGNIHHGWGNITAEQLADRFWAGTVSGGYVGHGETYLHPEDILWWSKGGALHGQSPARIAFLRSVLEDAPPGNLEPLKGRWDHWAGHKGEAYYLYYYGKRQPAEDYFTLPEGAAYTIDLLDTWNMTAERLPGTYAGAFKLTLPGKPYTAVRMARTEETR